MSIQAEITVTLAEVEVTDEYRIEVRQHEPVVEYTIGEAEQLANEIISAIEDARQKIAEDFPAGRLARHGFDVDAVAVLAGLTSAPALSAAELAVVARFGLDKPEQS